MLTTRIAFAGALAACLLITACDAPQRDGPSDPDTAASASVSPSPQPSASMMAPPALDLAALSDREDPERLMRLYAAAIREGRWDVAAQAWSRDAEVNAAVLEDAYGGGEPPMLTMGKGDQTGAAGSLIYEAPIVVTFSDERPELRGTIVARRVNDVPGASEEQLNWRIERSTALRPE